MTLEEKLVELAQAVGEDVGALLGLVNNQKDELGAALVDADFYYAYRNPNEGIE